jgi:hypothetical protein
MPYNAAPTIADIENILLTDTAQRGNPLTARTPHGDRLRHEAAQCLQRTARRIRAVAALAAADLATHERTCIRTARPTRCAWCARQIVVRSAATVIDGALLHAPCAADFDEFEPSDIDDTTTTPPFGLTPEPAPCP